MADVICPQCGGRYHETTDKFVACVTTTGDMLRLKETYRQNGWTSFPEHEGMSYGALECPECGGAYSFDGKVRIDLDQYETEQERKTFHGTEYSMIDSKEEKRRPGRPKK